MADGRTHRVVIVGGGFGGLQAATHLAKAPVEVTLVDRRNFHLFQPLSYQIATGALSAGEVCYPLRTIFQDRAGALWIGSDGGGLTRFDPQTAGVTSYRHDPNNPHSLSYNYVDSVYEGHDGVIWVSTLGGGLNRFDRATGSFTAYRHDPNDPRSLSQDIVTSLYEDHNDTLWVGTANGLNRFDCSKIIRLIT